MNLLTKPSSSEAGLDFARRFLSMPVKNRRWLFLALFVEKS